MKLLLCNSGMNGGSDMAVRAVYLYKLYVPLLVILVFDTERTE